MENFTGKPAKPKMTGKDGKRKSGLQNLAAYYQGLFDIDENFDHYSSDDYQNAKRKFVKYHMKHRKV
jgi:hypothetical protein